jgi:hypothetical protein
MAFCVVLMKMRQKINFFSGAITIRDKEHLSLTLASTKKRKPFFEAIFFRKKSVHFKTTPKRKPPKIAIKNHRANSQTMAASKLFIMSKGLRIIRKEINKKENNDKIIGFFSFFHFSASSNDNAWLLIFM